MVNSETVHELLNMTLQIFLIYIADVTYLLTDLFCEDSKFQNYQSYNSIRRRNVSNVVSYSIIFFYFYKDTGYIYFQVLYMIDTFYFLDHHFAVVLDEMETYWNTYNRSSNWYVLRILSLGFWTPMTVRFCTCQVKRAPALSC